MGSIYKRGSKLWLGYIDATGKQRCVSSGFPVGEETRAKKLLEKIEAKVAQERADATRPDGPVTVRMCAKQWIEQRRREGHSSVDDDESRLRCHALTVLGDIVLREVRPRHVQELVQKLKAKVGSDKKHLAPRTVRNVYGVLHAMFECAVADELIDTNPCVLKKNVLPKKIDKNPAWRSGAIFTREEAERMIADERIPEDRRIVYAIQFLAGVRFGEVAALRWSHYQSELHPLGKLVIARSYNTKKRVEKSVKTERPREMPVHPELARILADWREHGWQRLMGRKPTADDLIVPSREGRNRNVNHALKRFHEDLERVGLRTRRLHDARRTLISLARADGARGEVLEWCTHSPKGDIINLYTTLPWAAFCAEVAKLNVVWRPTPAPLALPTGLSEPPTIPPPSLEAWTAPKAGPVPAGGAPEPAEPDLEPPNGIEPILQSVLQTRNGSKPLVKMSGVDGTRNHENEQRLVEARSVSAGIPGVPSDRSAPSDSDAQGPCSNVVTAQECVSDATAQAEAGLVRAEEMVPKAEVVEAIENALHAFGVGRLDLAFAALRDLLSKLHRSPS